jgi:hypothetical protein
MILIASAQNSAGKMSMYRGRMNHGSAFGGIPALSSTFERETCFPFCQKTVFSRSLGSFLYSSTQDAENFLLLKAVVFKQLAPGSGDKS